MSVRFLMKAPPGQRVVRTSLGETLAPHEPVEYVEISGQHAGDVTCRRATDGDRSRHKGAYAAFKAEQAPKPVVKAKPAKA
jgi:hypothetical protein